MELGEIRGRNMKQEGREIKCSDTLKVILWYSKEGFFLCGGGGGGEEP